MRKSVAVAFGLCLCLVWPDAALAQLCNRTGFALADVYGGSGFVTSSHFFQLTGGFYGGFCGGTMKLRSRTYLNGSKVGDRTKTGGSAAISKFIIDSVGYASCNGAWTSSSVGDVAGFWIAAASSGVHYAYCLPRPTPIPIPECVSITDADTVVLRSALEGMSRSLTTAELKSDDLKLRFPLSRTVERPESDFIMEEWAFWDGERDQVLQASTRAFRDLVRDSELSNFEDVLVVQKASHPANSRYIPDPTVQPIRFGLSAWDSSSTSGSYWFRAELTPAGTVDRLQMLNKSSDPVAAQLRGALKDTLRLHYAGKKRHRVVVFGQMLVDDGGTAELIKSIPVLPRCCCQWPCGPY